MIEIRLSKYSDFKENVIEKQLDHFDYENQGRLFLIAIDGPVYFTHTLSNKDKDDYISNLKVGSNAKVGNFYRREPFASKTMKSGKNLFRRKHGYLITVPPNGEQVLEANVPYANCKINKLEVIDANARDLIDLSVLDTPQGLIQLSMGVPPEYVEPGKVLNQFGFNVVVSDLLYSDKSDYDADLIKDMKIKVVYKNRTDQEKEIGINIIFHELK